MLSSWQCVRRGSPRGVAIVTDDSDVRVWVPEDKESNETAQCLVGYPMFSGNALTN